MQLDNFIFNNYNNGMKFYIYKLYHTNNFNRDNNYIFKSRINYFYFKIYFYSFSIII